MSNMNDPSAMLTNSEAVRKTFVRIFFLTENIYLVMLFYMLICISMIFFCNKFYSGIGKITYTAIISILFSHTANQFYYFFTRTVLFDPQTDISFTSFSTIAYLLIPVIVFILTNVSKIFFLTLPCFLAANFIAIQGSFVYTYSFYNFCLIFSSALILFGILVLINVRIFINLNYSIILGFIFSITFEKIRENTLIVLLFPEGSIFFIYSRINIAIFAIFNMLSLMFSCLKVSLKV